MAKKPKINLAKWQELKRKIIIDKQSICSLAKEENLDERSIRRYLKEGHPDEKSIQSNTNDNPAIQSPENAGIAGNTKERIENAAVMALESLKTSGISEDDQSIALELALVINRVRSGLDVTAENNVSIAKTFSSIARKEADKLGAEYEATQTIDIDKFKQVGSLIQMTNMSSTLGTDLIRTDAMAKNKKDGEDARVIKLIDAPDV